MAKFKRDEARSFGFLWFVTGGIFAALSAWAVYNDVVTRTPWRTEQKEFFQVELDQAKRNLDREQAKFTAVKGPDGKTAQEKLDDLKKQQQESEGLKDQDPYKSAAADLKKQNDDYATTEQKKTFAKSDLDESYYYRTLAEYDRDDAEGRARAKLIEGYSGGDGRAAGEAAFLDPPVLTEPNDPAACPKRLKAENNCADLIHIENEVRRNEVHAKQARAAADKYPVAEAELNEAAAKAEVVITRIQKEIDAQQRIDTAVDAMLTIDDTRKTDRAAMASVDEKLETLEREVAKVNRPIEEAKRRLDKAEQRANPAFDVANIIGSLVGVYEINQIVSDWNGKMQVDRCTTCHMGVDSSNYGDLSVPRKFRTHPMRSQLFTTHPAEKFGCTSCHQGQGRATEATMAHSLWKLEDHEGEARWEITGDEYWESPMLQLGELNRVVIDERNDTVEADVGTGRFATMHLPRMEYATEADFLGNIQLLMQNELNKSPLSQLWRIRVVKVDGRVQIGLEPLTTEAETAAKKPVVRVSFKATPELGEMLGLPNRAGIAGNPIGGDGVAKGSTWVTAVLPPSVAVRTDDPMPAADAPYVPPSGRYGLQITPEYRDRFIQALPETQSGCLKCHAGETDLRPHKSKAQWITSKRQKDLREVQLAACKDVMAKTCEATDAACAAKHDECLKVTTAEEIILGDDPDKSPDMAPTLTEGRNLFKKLNCTGCHILDGFPGNRNAGPSLNAISAKVSPKWLLQWIRYPRAWRPKTRMPNLWPVPIDPESKRPFPSGSAEYAAWDTRMRSETLAIAAYLWDRSEHPEQQGMRDGSPMPAPQPALRAQVEKDYAVDELGKLGSTAEEGKKIFESVGCKGCHSVGEDLGDAWQARERDIAPNLGDVGNKMSAAWIAYWVENPSRYWPGTRMPNLRLTKGQAGSVALFLAQQKYEPWTMKADADPKVAAKYAAVLEPAPVDEKGELSLLSDETARKGLVKKGQSLIANYGCFGCHQIGGFEAYAPIAPELNGYSQKDTHTIDYGYAITSHHLKTWETFTGWKLDAPRIWATDRIELRMGDFDLSPKEIRALMVFLKGLAEDKIRPDLDPEKDEAYRAMIQGRDLVDEYNCRGCHSIEGQGGDIWTQKNVGELQKKSRQYGPPPLTGEGMRVQPEWFYTFLQNPGENWIRPFLHPEKVWGENETVPDDRRAVRMPTFPLDNAERTSIIRYFATWDGQEYPYQTAEAGTLDQDHKLAILYHLNNSDDQGQQCVQCHFVNDLPKEKWIANWESLAPNMGNVSRRLRPEWVKTWIENPRDFHPDTKMTLFWANAEGNPDPFGPPKAWTKPASVKWTMGDEQIAAYRDFLFTLGPNSHLPPPGSELDSPLVTGIGGDTVATAGGGTMETVGADGKPLDPKDAKAKDAKTDAKVKDVKVAPPAPAPAGSGKAGGAP